MAVGVGGTSHSSYQQLVIAIAVQVRQPHAPAVRAQIGHGVVPSIEPHTLFARLLAFVDGRRHVESTRCFWVAAAAACTKTPDCRFGGAVGVVIAGHAGLLRQWIVHQRRWSVSQFVCLETALGPSLVMPPRLAQDSPTPRPVTPLHDHYASPDLMHPRCKRFRLTRGQNEIGATRVRLRAIKYQNTQVQDRCLSPV